MLVMRRRAGETLLVGDSIEIEVLAIMGTRVKLGIVAPGSVIIQRKETQITREENITAAHSVDQTGIASLLSTVTFQAPAETVNSLTGAHILTGEPVASTPGKNIRTITANPDMS
jgi:carbon storage regulator